MRSLLLLPSLPFLPFLLLLHSEHSIVRLASSAFLLSLSHPAQPFLPHRIHINCVALSRSALVCLSACLFVCVCVCVLWLQLRCQRLKLNWFQVPAHLYFAGEEGEVGGDGMPCVPHCWPQTTRLRQPSKLTAEMRIAKCKKRIEAEQSKLKNHSAIRSDERTEKRERGREGWREKERKEEKAAMATATLWRVKTSCLHWQQQLQRTQLKY